MLTHRTSWRRCAVAVVLFTVAGCNESTLHSLGDAGGSRPDARRQGDAGWSAKDAGTEPTDTGTGERDAQPDEGDAGPAEILAAQMAAEAFVAFIDADDFGGAYDASSEVVRKNLTRANFISMLSVSLASVGMATQRAFLSGSAMTDPPGAPSGEYIALQFKTTFSSGLTLVEVVVMMRDPDGRWRMAGYSVTQA